MIDIPPPPSTSEPAATGPFTPGVPPAMCTHIESPAPVYVMTAAANGGTRAEYHNMGWTDEQLMQAGLMVSA